jgi:hypothetical protein
MFLELAILFKGTLFENHLGDQALFRTKVVTCQTKQMVLAFFNDQGMMYTSTSSGALPSMPFMSSEPYTGS